MKPSSLTGLSCTSADPLSSMAVTGKSSLQPSPRDGSGHFWGPEPVLGSILFFLKPRFQILWHGPVCFHYLKFCRRYRWPKANLHSIYPVSRAVSRRWGRSQKHMAPAIETGPPNCSVRGWLHLFCLWEWLSQNESNFAWEPQLEPLSPWPSYKRKRVYINPLCCFKSGLDQCFSKCGIQSSSISISWKFVRNVSFGAPPKYYLIWNFYWHPSGLSQVFLVL